MLQRTGENTFSGMLLGQQFALEKEADSWKVRLQGRETGLDASETEALFKASQTSEARFVTAGLNLDMLEIAPDPETAHNFADERAELTSQMPAGETVLLDTTTVHNAVCATKADGLIDPAMLLDLSVVAFAFIAFDNVVVAPHARHRWSDDDPRFGGALKTLLASRDLIMVTLWSICAPIKGLDYEREGYSTAWRGFLQRQDISLDGGVLDKVQDSPRYWDGVPASQYFSTLFLSEKGQEDLDSLNEFLSVQTIRALYNDEVAGLLKLPYLSCSLRAPIYSELLRRKLLSQLLADKLFGSLGPRPLEPSDRGSYVVEASAPFLLGILLSRMASPSDFWTVLHELRHSLAPLRRRLHEERDSWRGRTGPYLQGYLRHLSDYLPPDAKLAENALEATATAVASVATGSPLGGGAIKLVVKLAQLLKPTEKLYDWYLHTFRPDVAIVVELSKEAAKLRTVETEIERLWKRQWNRACRDQLEWLAIARPEAFAKLRHLG